HIFRNADLVNILLSDFRQIPIILVIIPIAIIFNKKRRMELLVCYFGYLSFPLIFTNLYYVHTYYTYANSVLASFLWGFFFISITEINHKRINFYVYVLLLPVVLLFTREEYKARYLPMQQADRRLAQELVDRVNQAVPANGV